jgi:hypothetical protein
VILVFNNLFSLKILTLALFYKEIPIRAIISIIYNKLVIIRRIINSCEKLKEARYKKSIIIIIVVKAI